MNAFTTCLLIHFCFLQMWDLTAGKLLADFKDHSGGVTTCEFHPDEFLLASGSSDRSVLDGELTCLIKNTKIDGNQRLCNNVIAH